MTSQPDDFFSQLARAHATSPPTTSPRDGTARRRAQRAPIAAVAAPSARSVRRALRPPVAAPPPENSRRALRAPVAPTVTSAELAPRARLLEASLPPVRGSGTPFRRRKLLMAVAVALASSLVAVVAVWPSATDSGSRAGSRVATTASPESPSTPTAPRARARGACAPAHSCAKPPRPRPKAAVTLRRRVRPARRKTRVRRARPRTASRPVASAPAAPAAPPTRTTVVVPPSPSRAAPPPQPAQPPTAAAEPSCEFPPC